ncbi:DNA sulfur modification protein DndD [Geodermatophilus dictyosporus]|uniref:Nuclease SbcCD subunit C n=1 Tax=Geodermatophilus dictyosporus TaxID=1523247 RepID=A0A1I5U2A0_9ACTN|nr:DNA sulfur modification protein DndD [Geodermatophilus dictyosporus]SFP89413.1 DNA sulfur modification protein DndD [Geodermatophilus dictyosporus]
MILDELVLKDFGAFAGRQVLPLTPQQDRPVILIGALNGTGKTTVLEALQLALFGALAPAGSRRGMSYEAYLRAAINDAQDPAVGAAVELAFRAHMDGVFRPLRIRRTWWEARNGKIREDVLVEVEGLPSAALSERWVEHVEAFVPRGVAQLFFFDGEQIEAFADLDVSRGLLETAIGGLLGLNLVDRLVADLEVLERRKRTEAVKDEEDERYLRNLEAALDSTRGRERDARQEVDQAAQQLARATERKQAAEERFQREGGRSHESRLAIEEQVRDARVARGLAETRLIEAMADFTPLLLVPDLVKATAQRASALQTQENDRRVVQALTSRDEELLALLSNLVKEGSVQGEALRVVETSLTEDRQRRSQVHVEPVFAVTPESAEMLRDLASGGMARLRKSVEELLANWEQAVEAVDRADVELASVPNAEAVHELVLERERATEAEQAASHALAGAHEAHAAVLAELTRAEAKRKIELERAARTGLAAEDGERLLRHSEKARATLRQLRGIATARHAQQIEAHVLEAAQSLLRKDRLLKAVEIDPTTHKLTLIDAAGKDILPSKLSAGERQMIAVSLLWGLAKAAGRPLPVVIDTPLGRLDRSHRRTFVDNYLPNASHQVIVLSTDAEVDEEAIRRLGSSVSHTVHLVHDATTRSSRIETGYVTESSGEVA